MSRQHYSTRQSTKKSKQPLSRQIDLLGGIHDAGIKYEPKQLETIRYVNPRTFKYEYIKAVHLAVPISENSIDTARAIQKARRMTKNGRDGILIIRKYH